MKYGDTEKFKRRNRIKNILLRFKDGKIYGTGRSTRSALKLAVVPVVMEARHLPSVVSGPLVTLENSLEDDLQSQYQKASIKMKSIFQSFDRDYKVAERRYDLENIELDEMLFDLVSNDGLRGDAK